MAAILFDVPAEPNTNISKVKFHWNKLFSKLHKFCLIHVKWNNNDNNHIFLFVELCKAVEFSNPAYEVFQKQQQIKINKYELKL